MIFEGVKGSVTFSFRDENISKKKISRLSAFENISSFKQLYEKKEKNNYSNRFKSSLLTDERGGKKKGRKIGETITSIHRQGEYTNNMKNRTTERMNGLVLFLDREYISSNNRGTVLKIAAERDCRENDRVIF